MLASLSHRRNIPHDKNESYLKRCTYNPKTDPLCPIIKLGTIVKEAGEDYNKLAYKVKKCLKCQNLGIYKIFPGRDKAAAKINEVGVCLFCVVFHYYFLFLSSGRCNGHYH